MADYVIERTVLGEKSKRLVLKAGTGNKRASLRKFAFGNNWNQIRIGMRFSTSLSSGVSGYGTVQLGICSGTDGIDDHFLGVQTSTQILNEVGFGYSRGQVFKLENSAGTSLFDASSADAFTYSKTLNCSGAWILDITRTSPDGFSINVNRSSYSTSPTPDYEALNITPEKFYNSINGNINNTIFPGAFGTVSTTSSETLYGDFDSVYLACNTTSFDMEILDLVVRKVS